MRKHCASSIGRRSGHCASLRPSRTHAFGGSLVPLQLRLFVVVVVAFPGPLALVARVVGALVVQILFSNIR